MALENADQLTENQRKDIEGVINRLIENDEEFDLQDMADEARDKLESASTGDYAPTVQRGFENLEELIERGSATPQQDDSLDMEDRIVYAGLKYFLDPWDIIPDVVPESGLIDDAYAATFAKDRLRSLQARRSADFAAEEVHHLAGRARDENAIIDWDIERLEEIGSSLSDSDGLSEKQKAFLEVQIEKIVENGPLSTTCPNSPCAICERFEEIAGQKQLA